ncbi:hypothetical protein DLE60_08225 [Micromonospora globispora]|nr:hypothetical protein DLE60_08225 [Micromonospora globispora]
MALRATALLQRIVRSARRIVTSRIIAIVIMASELAVTLVAMGQPPVAHQLAEHAFDRPYAVERGADGPALGIVPAYRVGPCGAGIGERVGSGRVY